MQDERYIVDPTTGCWVWQRARSSGGYGNFQDRCAHRVYYEMHVGPIPDGLVIDHLCRNKACVNPEHLEAVTQRENVHRGNRMKLSVEIAAEIRESAQTSRELASKFGLHIETVREVKRGERWAA